LDVRADMIGDCRACLGRGASNGAKRDFSVVVDLIPRTDYGPLDGRNFEHGWRGNYLQSHLLSDVGKKREKNEDSCIMCVPESPGMAEERGMLFAVADGMGGASAGEYASRVALHTLTNAYFKGSPQPVPIALRAAVESANEKVFEESEVNPLYSGMGTTVSALVVLGDWVYIAQVGDSRVYLLRERAGIHQLTHDHSLVAEQVRSGLISEEEARNHALKNLITRAVGIKDSVRVDLFALRLRQHDTLLLCSDGLCNMVDDNQIAAALALGDLKFCTRKLVEQALEGGGLDNITAVTLRVNGAPPKRDQEPGAEEIEVSPSGLFGRFRRLFS